MKKDILRVKENGPGRVGQVMKGNIICHKKEQPHAIKDPFNGELLVANEDIKKATLAYCVDNLNKKFFQHLLQIQQEIRQRNIWTKYS